MKKRPTNFYYYRVISCETIDGDTVKAVLDLGFGLTYSSVFRLFGINTPEKRPLVSREAAIASQNRLKELVSAGISSNSLTISTTVDHKKGKFGRYLCEIWCDDFESSFNDILLAEGFAKKFIA